MTFGTISMMYGTTAMIQGVVGGQSGAQGQSLASVCCALSPGFSTVHKNMPAVAGGLRWARELRQRIQGPFDNFRRMTHP